MLDALEAFAESLEMDGFYNVRYALDARMCCDGHMCGCRGSSVGEYLAWEIRQLIQAHEPK